MRLVHEPADGTRRVLATDVETADSWRAKIRGLALRDSLPDDYALVFPFGAAGYRDVHMLFVKVPLDVVWTVDGEVTQMKTLRPWRGVGLARADTFVELPGGAADGVEPGDTVRVDDGDRGGARNESGG